MAPQREWFEKDYYKLLGVPETAPRRRTSPRPTASWPASCTPTPTPTTPRPRSASRRCPPPTTSSATRPSARSTTRSARWARSAPASGRARRRPGLQRQRRRPRATCSVASSVGGNAGGRRQPGQPGFSRGTGPQRGTDLETELHLVVPRCRRRASPPRSTSPATRSARCATAAAPSRGATRSPARRAAAVASSTRTRASSPSARRVPSAAGAAPRSPTRATTAAAPACERRPREVKVRIPAGVNDGQRIRLKGRGGPGANGGPPGDLYVVVQVRARRPSSVATAATSPLTVPITFPEAALGAKVSVPTLDGDPVTLKIPAGTNSGRTFRVKGRGVAATGKRGNGDLMVKVEVAVPDQAQQGAEAGRRGVRQRHRRVATRAPRGLTVQTVVPRWFGRQCSASRVSAERVGEPTCGRDRPRRTPSTSSRSRPSWPASTRRPCASTSARASSSRPARRAGAAATATTTSTCCGASRTSPTTASTWPG